MAASELPCDFAQFVAERRGLCQGDAERLLATWLRDYQPKQRRAVPPGGEEHHDREAASYDICA